ncbi:MAG: HEAT repeat domain-containing protein [Candidatus Riflebacteria bacterium]|nr:HEAT repeat domain-containing protein [Candidatus Riflebacteria bacterium]
MNTLDYIMLGGLILLAAVVVIRIWLWRRQSAEDFSQFAVKRPQTVNSATSATAEKRSSSDVPPSVEGAEKAVPASSGQESVFQTRPAPKVSSPEITDPLVLIKTFSAPTEKRLDAIRWAGEKKRIEAVPALIEVLYEPDPEISSAAAVSLGSIGDSRAIEPLLEISRRSDAQLMKEIADHLDESTVAEMSSETSLAVISNQNPYNFKEMVVFKIDQLPKDYFQADGSPISRKELVVKGLKDNSQQMRQMAAKAAIGLDNEELVEPLIEALGNQFEVESVRFMAAEALGGMQNEKSVESLLEALKDDNVAVRYSAAAALSGRKDDKVIMALIERLNDPDRYVRSSVACALGTTGEKSALEALFSCADDESEAVIFSAAKAIAGFNHEDVHAEVAKRLDNADKPRILMSLEIFGSINDKRSVKALRKYLKSDDSEISYRASLALSGTENTDVVEDLIVAAKRLDNELVALMNESNNASVSLIMPRKEAVSGDGAARGIAANLEKLAKKLHDSSPNIRGSAANTLGDFKLQEAVDLLIGAVKDKNEFVRASVVTALGNIADFGALWTVITLEKDKSEEVRYAVVKALSPSTEVAALECLHRLMTDDKSKNIRRAAKLAIERRSN